MGLSKELIGTEVVNGFILEECSWFEQYGFEMDQDYIDTDKQALAQQGVEFVGYAYNANVDFNKDDIDSDYPVAIIGRDEITGELDAYFWQRSELVCWQN